jgi:site-specific DNA recombinase
VPLIFDLYANKRLGSRAIANWLTERGHRTNRGQPWSFRSVLTILRKRVYIGEIFFREKWHRAPHPPLVGRDVFNAAQKVLAERGEDHAKRRTNGSEYLLGGLVVCQSCGHRMVGSAARGRSSRYRYYTCYKRQRYGKTACDAERIDAGRLDQAVLDSLLSTFQNQALVHRAVADFLARANASRPQHHEQLAAVAAEISRTEVALDRYFHAFESGKMAENQCAPRFQA